MIILWMNYKNTNMLNSYMFKKNIKIKELIHSLDQELNKSYH